MAIRAEGRRQSVWGVCMCTHVCICVFGRGVCTPQGLKGSDCPTSLHCGDGEIPQSLPSGSGLDLWQLAFRVQSASSFRIFLLPQHNEVSASVSWKLELHLPRPIIGCSNSAYWKASFGSGTLEMIYWSVGFFVFFPLFCFLNLKVIMLPRGSFVSVICKHFTHNK